MAEENDSSRLKKLLPVAGAVAVAGAALLLNKSAYAGEPLPTAKSVDLKRYQGTWYEIARLPLYWENKCDSHVTATYRLLPGGKVSVLNTCRKKDGTETATHGTAEVSARDGSNSRLKVSFFWPFKGDYWILELDPEYRWALVGTPNLKHLWVLSRERELAQPTLQGLLEQAKTLGFDTAKVTLTKH